MLVNHGGLIHPPQPGQCIGARLQHIVRQWPLGLQRSGLPFGPGKLAEGHQRHHYISAGTDIEHMIVGRAGQDPFLQRKSAGQGAAGQHRILGLGRDPQQIDRLVVVEPEPVDRFEQLGVTAHQIRSGRPRPQAHGYPIECQHLFVVIRLQLQPLLAGQQLAHGVLTLTGCIDAGFEDRLIAAKVGLIFTRSLAGQLAVALITGSEKQPEPAIAVGGIASLQDAVIADRLGVALLVAGGTGHPFQRTVADGAELARFTGGQRPLAITPPQLHGDQVIEHLAITTLSIESIQPVRCRIQLSRSGLDHPGFTHSVHLTGTHQQGQQRQHQKDAIHSQHTTHNKRWSYRPCTTLRIYTPVRSCLMSKRAS